ncbi:hypothetical protein DSO57_1014925 [Entomophthora muscae]|uniref:Uncharacterized protein n=1 Tax=Entomophthora muscae TaxID=34485 RepID=A0ACC2U4M4_9FUNG|nr:hypothetical protein DSO57_1014925 [Entomophthora muscae]
MVLGSGFKWPGRGDFSTYHQTKGTAHLSNLCEEENKFIEAYYCFQNPSQKYRFGEVSPVSNITVCLEPKCHVITETTITIGIIKEKWTRNSPAVATKLMAKFIPDPLAFNASASSQLNLSYSFRGPGFAQIFKPLYYLLEGDFTAVHKTTIGLQKYTKMTSFAVPLILQDGSLDGVYEVVSSNQ